MRRRLEARNLSDSKTSTLSYTQFYLCGAFAGLANSVLSGPIEHVRIRLQTQPHDPTQRLYKGPVDCMRKLAAHEGVLAGLYRGQAVTLLREAQAYGVWFLAFEYLMNADARRNGVERGLFLLFYSILSQNYLLTQTHFFFFKLGNISTLKIALYGGLAGEALWLSSYPLDVIKSKMQTDGFRAEKRYPTMVCF